MPTGNRIIVPLPYRKPLRAGCDSAVAIGVYRRMWIEAELSAAAAPLIAAQSGSSAESNRDRRAIEERAHAHVALCAELDALAPRFPGTRLRYAVGACHLDNSTGVCREV